MGHLLQCLYAATAPVNAGKTKNGTLAKRLILAYVHTHTYNE